MSFHKIKAFLNVQQVAGEERFCALEFVLVFFLFGKKKKAFTHQKVKHTKKWLGLVSLSMKTKRRKGSKRRKFFLAHKNFWSMGTEILILTQNVTGVVSNLNVISLLSFILRKRQRKCR